MSTQATEQAFEDIFFPAIINAGEQLYSDRHPQYPHTIARPINYWVKLEGNEREAYEEALDTWAEMMDAEARLSFIGLLAANRSQLDPSKLTLEDVLSKRHGITNEMAFRISSRALWDILLIRGLPSSQPDRLR